MVKNFTTISLGTYQFALHYAVGLDMPDLLQHLAEAYEVKELSPKDAEKFTNLGARVVGFTVQLERGDIVIWLKDPPNSADAMGTLAHEVFHAVRCLFLDIGIPLDHTSEEAWAYQIDYIISRCLGSGVGGSFTGVQEN